MGLKLEKVIPWGRSLTEYVKMFHLTPHDLDLRILDVPVAPCQLQRRDESSRILSDFM
jgi:hypothetical protein